MLAERGSTPNVYLNRIHPIVGNIAEQDTGAIVMISPINMRCKGEIYEAIMAGMGIEPKDMRDYMRNNIFHPRTRQVFAIPPMNLPCEHLFIALMPTWKDEWSRHGRHIINACRMSMNLAKKKKVRSLSFAPFGTGYKGFKKTRAVSHMVRGVTETIDSEIDEVRFVCRSESTRQLFKDKLDLKRF